MRRLNQFFFGVEEIHPSDSFWFYGSYAVLGIIVGSVSLSVN